MLRYAEVLREFWYAIDYDQDVARKESILQVAVFWALFHFSNSQPASGQRNAERFTLYLIYPSTRRRWAVVAKTPYRKSAITFKRRTIRI